MGAMKDFAMVGAALLCVVGSPRAQRLEFVPRQVWASPGVDPGEVVHFVVLRTEELPGIGKVVCTRIGGVASPDVKRPPTGFAQVFPATLLVRYAGELVANLPQNLFAPFDFAAWESGFH